MSTDGTRGILEDYARAHPGFRVIENRHRITSHGLNRAIEQATGEFIVRMDAHTEYPPDYVVRCVNVSLATGAANVGGAALISADGFWERAIGAGFHSSFATGGASFRREAYSGFTDTVPYGCWRRGLLLKLGGFDEALVRNQDDELNLRIRRVGGTVWQDASIASYYHPRRSLRALFRQYFQYGFWRVAVLRKHGGVASVRQLAPIAALAVGALFVLGIGLGGALHQRWLTEFSLRTLVVLVGIYAVLSITASITSAKRHGWDLLPVLPLVFGIYQFGYAAGFAAGLLYWMRPKPQVLRSFSMGR